MSERGMLTGKPQRQRRLMAAGLALGVALAGGCRRPPPRVAPEMPALEVPPPPPRNVEPQEAQVPQPVPLVDVPARTVERPPAAPVAPPRESNRAEPKPGPPAEPPRASEEARPGTTLQTTPTDREAELEKRIRAMLVAAAADLSRIDYRKLNPDTQLQYDTAKSFIRQAEDALKSRNLVYAQTNAEKAATLASQLAGR